MFDLFYMYIYIIFFVESRYFGAWQQKETIILYSARTKKKPNQKKNRSCLLVLNE